MEGDKKAGFTIFWADDGLDTGPILLQRSIDVDIGDTVDSLYNRFLFPEGIRAMVGNLSLPPAPLGKTADTLTLALFSQGEAVKLIEEGKAPKLIQWEGGATYDQKWSKKELAKVRLRECWTIQLWL